MELIVRIARNIKRFRQERGLSRRGLSEGCGVPYQTLCNLEKERVSEPRLHTLLNIAETLGISLDDLCAQPSEPHPPKDAPPKTPSVRVQPTVMPRGSHIITLPLQVNVEIVVRPPEDQTPPKDSSQAPQEPPAEK